MSRGGARAWAALPLLLAVPSFAALFGVEWFENHETTMYLARVVETNRCWEDGMISARWFPDLAGGFGYPYLAFYAPLTFWISAGFCAAGMPVVAALKATIALATLVGAAGAYRLAREGTGRVPALLACALYTYAPYRLRDLWVRGDLAELLALGVLPWALALTLRLRGRPTVRGVVAAGAVGAATILSHNIVALLAGLALIVTALVAATWPIAPRRRVLAAAATAGALALLLSAFFWTPALAEKKWTRLDALRQGFFGVEQNFLEPREIFAPVESERRFVPGQPEVLGFGLGLAAASGLAGLAAMRSRQERPLAVLGLVLAACGLVLSVPAAAPLYERLPLLRFVQFPWRFLALTSLGGAVAAAAGLSALGRGCGGRAAAIAAAALAVFAVIETRAIARPFAEIDVEDWMLDPATYREQNLTIGAVEFTPIWVERREPLRFEEGVSLTGRGRLSEVDRGVARWRFTVEAYHPQAVVLQAFWFPDWRGTLDGMPVEIRPRAGSGLAEFDCPEGRHVFEGRHVATPLRLATAGVSGLAAVASLVALAAARRRSR
ncbi:MAG: 6-pyruvoyl-tetrahydropterin synthase-related protein [Candidatus Eiseniibacteriota bacterium]